MPRQPFPYTRIVFLSLVCLFLIIPTPVEAGACQESSFRQLDEYRTRILKKYQRALGQLESIDARMPTLFSEVEGDFSPDVVADYFMQPDNRRTFIDQRAQVAELIGELDETKALVDSASEMGGKLKKLGALLSESCRQAGAPDKLINLADRFEEEGFALGHAKSRPFYDVIEEMAQALDQEQTLLRQVRSRMPDEAFRD